jgi:hypothetical protein
MKRNFDWQVADEELAPDLLEPEEEPRPRRRPGPGLWLMLLLVAGTLGWLTYQGRQRTEAAEAAAVADLLADHRLLLQAAASQDRELATNLLSGRDRAWAAQQRARVAAGTLLQEPGLGLAAAGGAGDAEPAVSWLAPALDEATVVMTQTVTLPGAAETGLLARSWLYRRGEGRWLYAPPRDPAGYWGPRKQLRLAHLAIQYPTRDEALARRLAGEMAATLERACAQAGGCPDELEMVVVLTSQPSGLETPALEELVFGDGPLYLPAPSWIGEPADESGFRLLARAYSRPLLLAALGRELWAWRCCNHAPLVQALLNAELARLDVQPWPMSAEDYAFLTARDFRLFEDTMASWHGQAFSRQRDLAWLQAHAVVGFLLAQNPDADLGKLAAQLNEATNYWFWAYDFLDERVGDRELEERWRAFAEANS